jgi:hypothetical protein
MSEPGVSKLGKLGRLPPELRFMVYQEVLGPTGVITPMMHFQTALSGDQLLQPGVYIKAQVQTSILTTNKKISEEALETLYRGRIVRGSISELQTLLCNDDFRDLVEEIEIDDHFTKFRNHRFAHMFLLWTQNLPQIRSVTILSDKFAFTQHNGRSYITAREFATMMHLGEATCVDIGRFKLSGKFSYIQIIHRKLVKMWPNVASTPEDYDVYADVLGLDSVNDECILSMCNGVAWAAQTSLRRWVGLYDEFLQFRLDPFLRDKTNEQRALLGRFVLSTRKLQHLYPGSSVPSYVEYMYQSRVRNRLMHTLRPSDDPEMLAWATDLLSVNIAAFIPLRGRRPQAFLQRAHWAETDGGLHTLDFMKMHLLSARRGNVDAFHVSHPVFPEILEYTTTIQSSLILADYPRQTLRGEAHDLNPRQIRQLYLLLLAMDHVHYINLGQQRLVDAWSLRLFQRYLLADPFVHEDEACLATLDDMRLVMRVIIYSLCPNEANLHSRAARLRRTYEPAGGLIQILSRPWHGSMVGCLLRLGGTCWCYDEIAR